MRSRCYWSHFGDDLFAPLLHSGAAGFQLMSRTVQAFRHFARYSQRGALPYSCRPPIDLLFELYCWVRRGLSRSYFPLSISGCV